MTPFIPPSIKSTIPLNTPKAIQTPSLLVYFPLVSYVVLLISNGSKSCLFLTGWLYMTLVIIGIILHMFLFVLNSYGSDRKSIHHSYFYTHQFFLVAHAFPSLALYPHGVTKDFAFIVPFANVYDISFFIILISYLGRFYIGLEE